MTTEQRLEAFFKAIAPAMEDHKIAAIMISVSGYDEGDALRDTFVCLTRIGLVSYLPKVELEQHLERMHDDMHEVLEDIVDKLQHKPERKTPIEYN